MCPGRGAGGTRSLRSCRRDRTVADRARLAQFPDIFTALERQVGLRLEETTAKTEFWVIERVERPSEN
jgi:uncharacterized protein (TIGR03435 family)